LLALGLCVTDFGWYQWPLCSQYEPQNLLGVTGLAGYKADIRPDMSAITHTPASFHSPVQHRRKKSKNNMCMQREHPNCTIFFFFSFPDARRLAQKGFRCAAGRLDGTWYLQCAVDLNTKNWSYGLVLEPREAIYIASTPWTLSITEPQKWCFFGIQLKSFHSHAL
jgi:hypothetical protein